MRWRCPTLMVLSGQAEFVRDGDGLALDGFVHDGRAVFELEFFRAAQRDFQAVGEVVGDVVAANREHAGVLDDAADIDDVIGGAAADVNDERAEFLLLVREQRERGGEAVEDDFVHLNLKAFDEADGVLEAVRVAVDDVDIHFEPRAEHPDGIGDAVLAVHKKMLADGVDDIVLGREIDGLGVFDDILNVVVGNLAVGGNHGMDAAVVEAADVAAGDAEINIADFRAGHVFGLDDGVPHVLLGLFRVHDFALADAARTRLAEADDVQRAVGGLFADHGADFRRANFQTDNDVRVVKHFSSALVQVLSFSAQPTGAALASIQRTGTLLATAKSAEAMALLLRCPKS